MLRFLAFFLLCSVAATAQDADQQRRAAEAREKIERLLRIQDLRTPHDGFLQGAISDREPLVRRRACLAYASLQDTSALGQLVGCLADPDTLVQQAAAFAIGQTGVALSETGRQRLEDDLLWKRLNETSARDRLIEEIGKFGTGEALRQLLLREGNIFPGPHTPALQRSIGRFAIRSVVSDEGVRFLLHSIRPADAAPWQVVYALQRIGDHQEIHREIDHLILLREHPDPLVRMNLATLFGKVRMPQVLRTLQELGLRDPDWRVRVNALRALGSQGLRGRDESIDVVRRSLFDAQPNVALAAIGAAGASDLDQAPTDSAAAFLLDQLKLIARNKAGTFHWHMQAEAAHALAAVIGTSALRFCRPAAGAWPGLAGELLRAAGKAGGPDALPLLTAHLQDESPRILCGALDGMAALLERHPADSGLAAEVLSGALAALRSSDVAVVSTAASLLGQKRLVHLVPVAALTGRLAGLRLPDDIEAFQGLCATIGEVGDRTAVPALLELLELPDPAVARAAADALERVTGADYRPRIPRRTEPLYTDFDFATLRALPDTIPATLETVRGRIRLILFKEAAPFTIMALAKLADQRGFFRGRTFHRVVPNFVIQGGDPRGDGWGGPGFTLRSEFSPLTYETGTVGIASAGKDTEGSQFFITHSPQPHLDGRYTIIGKVIEGEDVVDQIQLDDRVYEFRVGQQE